MKKIKFFVSGSCADCLDYFQGEHVHISFHRIVELLTKGAAYKLYLSESYEEAKRLGECIYQFKVPANVIESNLFKYEGKHFAPDIPVNRIQ